MAEEKKRASIKKLNLLISLLIAFSAWVYVIYNFAPTKVVTYRNVPIDFEGEDTLAYENLGVVKSSDETVDIKASVRRVDYGSIDEDSFHVIADVSAAVDGVNGISLDVEAPDGVEIKNISTSSVTVKVGASATKDVNVAVTYDDAPDSVTEPIVNSISYRRVSIYGAKKNVNRVKYAVGHLSVTDVVENSRSFTVNPVAYDDDGKIVEHIVILPSEIHVSACTGSTKEVSLKLNVKGTAEELTYKTADKIVIKGTEEALADIEEIETEEIDLSGITEDTEIPLTYILPDGISVTKEYIAQTLQVKVNK